MEVSEDEGTREEKTEQRKNTMKEERKWDQEFLVKSLGF